MYEGEGKLVTSIYNMKEVQSFNDGSTDVGEVDMEESFTTYEGTFQMGSLQSDKIDCYEEC